MLNKLLLIIAFISFSGCGKKVDLSNSKLEQASSGTQVNALVANQTGTLIRRTNSIPYDQVQSGGQTHRVSIYSSYLSLEFIASRPMGSSTAVKYKGSVQNGELLLQLMEPQ